MTTLEDPSKIENIVGAKRDQTEHIGRAVSAETVMLGISFAHGDLLPFRVVASS